MAPVLTNIHSHTVQNNEFCIFNQSIDNFQIDQLNFISLGIHPWYINENKLSDQLSKLKELVSYKNVLAIGECGLDRLAAASMQLQEIVFLEQIKIAEEIKKPLIIHCVKAFDDLIRIKKEQKISVPMIVHGYNNNEQIAEQLLKNGFYLSLGKALLMDESNAQRVLLKTDFDHFFLETDNSDVSIKAIFEKAAELKKMSLEELKEKMFSNFKKVFNYG